MAMHEQQTLQKTELGNCKITGHNSLHFKVTSNHKCKNANSQSQYKRAQTRSTRVVKIIHGSYKIYNGLSYSNFGYPTNFIWNGTSHLNAVKQYNIFLQGEILCVSHEEMIPLYINNRDNEEDRSLERIVLLHSVVDRSLYRDSK